ncbi:MAG: glycosyltransferase family 4 protein [Granulosicoccaceae bacterium]
MAKISIIGSYPPHYGGISMHVQRLHALLGESNDCRVVDMYAAGGEQDDGVDRVYGNKLLRVFRCRQLLARRQSDIEHFHVSAMRKFLWGTPALLTGRKHSRKVLTIHGGAFPDVVASLSAWEKRLFGWMLNRFDHFVCVSEKQRLVLDEWRVPAEKISVVNAYLPPVASPPSGLFAEIEEARAQGSRILLCSAMYMEHYGITELYQAMEKLEQDLGNSAPRLVLVTYADLDESYREKCRELQSNIAPTWEFDRLNPEQVAELMALSDVFVRATYWDGDAVSVRESAFFGNRIVATDVTTRPEGSILCKDKDPESLYLALKQAMEDEQAGTVSFDHQLSLRALVQVYKDLGAANLS